MEPGVEPKASQKESDVLVAVGDPGTVEIDKASDTAIGDDHIRRHISPWVKTRSSPEGGRRGVGVDLGGGFAKAFLIKIACRQSRS